MRKILFMALAVLIAAGCAESEKGTLCVKIAPAIRTRVTGLHFDTGDRIGLTISKGSALYAENVPMTYDGTAFTASGLSWYNDLNEKSVLTAYYPYAEGGRPDEFTVSSDQTQGNGPSDLLAAVKTDVTPVSAPVGMIFYHVMSQLTIVVSNSSSAAVTGVSVGGLVPTAEIDYSAPKAAAKSGVAAAEVKACEVKPGATYRAILVPQQAALTVTVTTDDGRSHTKTLSSAQLESGRRYDMSVLVTNEEIQISLSGDIGDWEDGGSLDGSGGGDGGVARELGYYDEIEQIDVVEPDRVFVEVCKEFFPDNACGLSDERVTVYYEDGLKFLRMKHDEYDLIINDAIDPLGHTAGLFTKEFYGNCFRALKDDGIMVYQHGSPFYDEDEESCRGMHRKASHSFPISRVYQAHIPTCSSGYWLFGFASKKYHPLDDLDAKRWKERKIKTWYYTTNLHKGAFMLPRYVEDMLEEEEGRKK